MSSSNVAAEQLQNQLRFNMEIPYNINKLAARVKKPKPITIEKATPESKLTPQVLQNTERDLDNKFTNLSIERLKHAQFLAQRQLKRTQNAKLYMSAMTERASKPFIKIAGTNSPTRGYGNATKIIKPKASPKKVDDPPGSENSPPTNIPPRLKNKSVRRNLHKYTGALEREAAKVDVARVSKSITQELPGFNASLQGKAQHGRIGNEPIKVLSTPGVVRQRIIDDEDDEAKSMPNLHFLAMEQLMRVKQGVTSLDPKKKSVSATPKVKAPSGRVGKRSKTSIKTYAHKSSSLKDRPARRRIAGRELSPRAKSNELPRYHVQPEYDPDYLGPEEIKKSYAAVTEAITNSPEQDKFQLPEASEFVQRIYDARKHREAVDRFRKNPKAMVDEIEKEARSRLEPLLRRAETLSQTMISNHWNRPSEKTLVIRTDSSEDQGDQLAGDIATEEQESEISPAHLYNLKTMLNRLDEMEQEHVQIRHRWMTAGIYDEEAQLLPITDSFHVEVPDLIKLAESKADVQKAPEPISYDKSKKQNNTSAKKSNKKATRMEKQPIVLKLVNDKIRSIKDSRKGFDHHLNNISHNCSAGFDPWKFANEVAEEIVQSCVAQVAEEMAETGSSAVEQMYADEYKKPDEQPSACKAARKSAHKAARKSYWIV